MKRTTTDDDASEDNHADISKRIKTEDHEPSCDEARMTWARPPLLVGTGSGSGDLIFQHVDGDYAMSDDHEPVVRLFGVTPQGHSVMVHVHDFMPYFYVAVPPSASAADAESFGDFLNERLEKRPADRGRQVVLGVTPITGPMSITGYHGRQSTPTLFYKITCAAPMAVPRVRKLLEDGVDGVRYQTFESNVAFILRYMVDANILGCQWLRLKAGTYHTLSWQDARPASRAQHEIHCSHTAIEPIPLDSEQGSGIAALRILSFDIECAGRPGIFPEAEHDPVIQIANMVTLRGQETPFIKNIFVLGSCSSIMGADVRCFHDEAALLKAWRAFVLECDPDVLTGYNIEKFDIPYLLDRAQTLGIKEFPFLTRLYSMPCTVRDSTFSSNQTGKSERKQITIHGRLVLDMYQAIQREHKLSSYTLNNVSATFLGQQKEDVHHSQISVLHAGGPDDRRRLAVYCLKDAALPQRLVDKLMTLVNYVEMARATGVPFTFLTTRGQTIKVMSLVLRTCRSQGYLVPTMNSEHRGGAAEGDEVGYEGATVLEPQRGYYDKPVATLDFASLYPSIMMAHNLCYTTLVASEAKALEMGLVKDVDYEMSPSGNCFVKPTVRKGILPRILESLIAARGHAKRLMAQEKDKFKQQIYNGRQLALKVTANSVYGFTGQSIGQLPCLEISASVTAFGRQMIELTRQTVLTEYCVEKGHSHDSEVIYGDTANRFPDSVMVVFGPTEVAECMKLGREAAKRVTQLFIKPISLEFEKVYFPYLLISKKRYAGLFWTKPEKFDKMDAKGIESQRRDNCPLVRRAIDTSLRRVLIQRDVPGAVEFVKQLIRDVLQDKCDLSQLIITKQLKDKYKTPQPHFALAERMRKRDPATAPAVGDRVAFVILRGDKKAKLYERAEDPLYAMEHDLPVDAQYYLENQLGKPLVRLFSALMPHPESLLTGDHTRTIAISTSTSLGAAHAKGLMRFAKVKETCYACRAPLVETPGEEREKVLCRHCAVNAPSIYQGFMVKFRQAQMEHSRLWTQCQQCQGSVTQEVICNANDCPIYYRRFRVKKDLVRLGHTAAQFEDLTW